MTPAGWLFIAVLGFGVTGWLLWGNWLGGHIAEVIRRRRMPPPTPPQPPRIRISIPHGEAIFTRVWLDGHELGYVTHVAFSAASHDMNGMAIVTIQLHAQVDLEGNCGLVIQGIDPRTGASYEVRR